MKGKKGKRRKEGVKREKDGYNRRTREKVKIKKNRERNQSQIFCMGKKIPNRVKYKPPNKTT